MADLIFGCVKDIGNCILTEGLWPPVKCHIDYWWCFNDNIQGLRDGVTYLDSETYDINQKIKNAQYQAENLKPWVQNWSNEGTEKLVEARRILQNDNIPKAWNLISRYSVGKSAKKTAEEIAKHRNHGKSIPISDPAPPPSMGSTSHRPTTDIESRKCIEKDIIESLGNSSVRMIGICGMGGVGKTTMVRRIWKRVREENLFDEVVMVTVSHQVDMLKIQKEIAVSLRLEFDVGDESMSTRAIKLHRRLIDKNRKIIIFDDVWESLKLEDLGVPFESDFERCKILLTTRSRDICVKMESQKVIAMEVLTKEEAWSLFKEKAGDCVENSVLRGVAKDVVAECKGLPIALVTLGKALQNKVIYTWKDSLTQLRRSNPTYLKDVLVGVYNPLKLSYDYLEHNSEKSLFLLCCLFPEDCDILVEQLVWYGTGLQIFDIMSIEDARNRTYALVEELKSRFLLMDGDDENHVKMHDVVRDVAIFIGSKEMHGFLKSLEVTSMDLPRENSSLNWMSVDISNERMELPLWSHFPNLHLLMMLKSTSNEVSDISFEEMKDLKVSDISFEGMEDLNVLSLLEIEFPSLPQTLRLLKNLKTLLLHCSTVTNISVIGELASLEILSCSGCDNIVELPAEIGGLKKLRLLELWYCNHLKTLAFGIISSLDRLEELKILGSFSGWEAGEKGKKRRNAALTELQYLTNLTCLEIYISDWTLAAQEICLSQKLVKYQILISPSDDYFYDAEDLEKVMYLHLPRHITVGEWIHILVRNTEFLRLKGDGSNNFNLAESLYLRQLEIQSCSTVKKLVNTIDCKGGTVFRYLERLELNGLEILEEICDGTIPEGSSNLQKSPNQNVSLGNLKIISIKKCSKLRCLFSVSMARNLLQLEKLVIEYCDTMEYVIWNENKSMTAASIEFPKLKTLILKHLPNLTAFWQGFECIQFPQLTEMEIYDLPMLNSPILCNQKVEIGCLKSLKINELKDNISNIWCHQIPINFFSNLEELKISDFDGIRNLMSSSIPINLVSLKSLSIGNCPKMVGVIEDKEVVDLCKSPNQNVSLSNLTYIQISHCSNLRYLFSVLIARSLSQLENLEIKYCGTIDYVFWNENKSMTDASIELPKLKKLTLRDLPNLKAFCQGVETIQCPMLTEMNFFNLPMLDSVSPLNSEPLHGDTSFHFLCNQKVEIGDLKSMTINKLKDNIDNILCHHTPINFFSNLEELDIIGLNDIRNLMSSSILINLVSLKFLSIKSCPKMVEVIEIKSITAASIQFPKLKTLILEDLQNLATFCQGVESIQFLKLTDMNIKNLPKLNSLCPHDDTSFHFLCNQKVEIGVLERLTIDGLKDNISNIWCQHIPINFFSNLEILNISNLNGIRNLMSSSIAKNLVSLNYLSVESCQEMVEVIEDEEEVVDMSFIPALKYLKIKNLLKLRSFCQWKNAFELPLLKEVEITKCPVMETFSLGSLSTPNIKWFNWKMIDNTKDLNAAIHHFRAKSHGKGKGKDEDDGDDSYEDEDEDEDEDDDEEEDEDNGEDEDIYEDEGEDSDEGKDIDLE